jgi:hypothetical protein
MKKILVVCFMLFAHAAWAGDYEDGVAAYKKGDYVIAFNKLKKSAERPPNSVKAHMWLNLAAANGYLDAIKGRDNVSKTMSPQQIAQAQQMASACQASNYKNCD